MTPDDLYPGTLVVHVRTQGRYTIVCQALNEADEAGLVVYRSVKEPHETWVRPLAEFIDGRFELAPIPKPVSLPKRVPIEISITWEEWYVLSAELGITDSGKLEHSNGASLSRMTEDRLAIVGYLNERTALEAFEIVHPRHWSAKPKPWRHDADSHVGMAVTGQDGSKFIICTEAFALVPPPASELKDEGSAAWWEKRKALRL